MAGLHSGDRWVCISAVRGTNITTAPTFQALLYELLTTHGREAFEAFVRVNLPRIQAEWDADEFSDEHREVLPEGAKSARERELEDLLRSAHCIAERRGENTAWERFAASIKALGIGSATARPYLVLSSDAPPADRSEPTAHGSAASAAERERPVVNPPRHRCRCGHAHSAHQGIRGPVHGLCTDLYCECERYVPMQVGRLTDLVVEERDHLRRWQEPTKALLRDWIAHSEKIARDSYTTGGEFNDEIWRENDSDGFALVRNARQMIEFADVPAQSSEPTADDCGTAEEGGAA